jgi:hypothetical protein
MMMLQTRLDDKDFGPRVPALRLALLCAAFGALGYLFALETRNTLTYNAPVSSGFWVERAFIAAMLAGAFAPLALWLLLPLRLRFTDAGILRRTLLRPRFIPWQNVTGGAPSSFKANVMLELRVTNRRLPVLVPLTEYRRPAALLAELSRRLPARVSDTGGQLATRLKDE